MRPVPSVVHLPISTGHTAAVGYSNTMADQSPRISKAAIHAARAAFAQRIDAAAGTIEGLSFAIDDVVIARHVTRAQLDRVPRQWLQGIQVALHADGTFALTGLDTRQHHQTSMELVCQIRNGCAAAARSGPALVVHHVLPLRLPDGAVRTPDVVVVHPSSDAQHAIGTVLALCHVVTHHCTMADMMRDVADWFTQLPSVQRVVVVKFYPPRQPDLDTHGQLRVPALAMVVCRATRGDGGLTITQLRSFGNVDVDERELRYLTRSPTVGGLFTVTHVDPLDLGLAPWRARALDVATLDDDVTHLLSELPPYGGRWLDLAMPAPWPAMHVDLALLFGQALRGWSQDQWATGRVFDQAHTVARTE